MTAQLVIALPDGRSGRLRVRLAGNSYDLNLTNGGTGIRLNFVPVVP